MSVAGNAAPIVNSERGTDHDVSLFEAHSPGNTEENDEVGRTG
jgi:hypothetical protein